ncbi:DUF1893 domain-containing protein [Guggenheimella bovis]
MFRVIKDEQVLFESKNYGLKPILDAVEKNVDLQNSIVENRVIGYQAAQILMREGVETVHARYISKSALELMNRYGVDLEFDYFISGAELDELFDPLVREHAR